MEHFPQGKLRFVQVPATCPQLPWGLHGCPGVETLACLNSLVVPEMCLTLAAEDGSSAAVLLDSAVSRLGVLRLQSTHWLPSAVCSWCSTRA